MVSDEAADEIGRLTRKTGASSAERVAKPDREQRPVFLFKQLFSYQRKQFGEREGSRGILKLGKVSLLVINLE